MPPDSNILFGVRAGELKSDKFFSAAIQTWIFKNDFGHWRANQSFN